MKKAKPVQIRLGKLRLAVWKNEPEQDQGSLWFNWSLEKRYQKDGEWQSTYTFRDSDAPTAICLLIVGTLRMVKQLVTAQNSDD